MQRLYFKVKGGEAEKRIAFLREEIKDSTVWVNCAVLLMLYIKKFIQLCILIKKHLAQFPYFVFLACG